MPQPLCFNCVPPAQPPFSQRQPLYSQGKPRGEGKTNSKDPTFYYLVATLNTRSAHTDTHRDDSLNRNFPAQKCPSFSFLHHKMHTVTYHIWEKTIPKYFHSVSWQYFLHLNRKECKIWEAAIRDSPHKQDSWPNTCNFQRPYLKCQNSSRYSFSIF